MNYYNYYTITITILFLNRWSNIYSHIQLTNHSTFLDVSACKYISYETASQLAATYPNLVMKVDNSLFSNKHRLKKDTALVKALYKLVWNDDAINSRVLGLFQNLRKLDLSVCEVNLSPTATNTLALGYIRFLKLTNVAFTKPNSLHNLLKSSTTLEVSLLILILFFSFCLQFHFSFLYIYFNYIIFSHFFLAFSLSFSFLFPHSHLQKGVRGTRLYECNRTRLRAHRPPHQPLQARHTWPSYVCCHVAEPAGPCCTEKTGHRSTARCGGCWRHRCAGACAAAAFEVVDFRCQACQRWFPGDSVYRQEPLR